MKTESFKPQVRGSRLLASCLAGAGLALTLSGAGCVNTRLPSANSKVSGQTAATGNTPTAAKAIDKFVIGNVNVAPPPQNGGGAQQGPATTIYIDTSHSTSASGPGQPPIISQHCSAGGGNQANGKPCVCQFTWSETNSATGGNQPFTRVVQQPLTNVQQALAGCNAPDVYSTEIGNGTTIKVTILPGSNNPDAQLFTVTTFSFVKNTVTTAGSFQDAEGHAFDNIVHYSCYEQFKIGTKITSRMGTQNNPQTGEPVTYPISNKFCVQSANNAGGAPGCPNLTGGPTNSAQAYYYNFFLRASQAGDANQWNNRYTCPSIKEPIYNGGTVGAQGNLYPMDTGFALSMGPTPQFNIGVNAFVELADGGADPISVAAQTCDGQVPAGNNSTDGFVQACIGYATKPNADGTCPYIRDSNGAIRFTYRLRRFIALYPPLFGIDGKAPNTPQRTDSIYVLDRPVTPPAGSDPLKPYTMRGPKPCPFALFDSKGVLGYFDGAYVNTNGRLPIYGSTNNPAWNGTNVDGIQLPNFDGPNSCSTAIPLVKSNALNPDLAVLSIGTLNALNPVLQTIYIRPVHSWAPHYEEDTSFQACAPQASPVHDPPLHFSKDLTTGNVSWCAEVYPSQNDHVAALDQLGTPTAPLSATNTYIGHVRPFTSHIAKNSLSADCAATIPSSIPPPDSKGNLLYPAINAGASCAPPSSNPSGIARHPADALVDTKNNYTLGAPVTPLAPTNVCANQTCDRTAIITGGLGWQQFPLLATAPQVEAAISADTTYGCVLTYDGGGPKTGKATPAMGCCGANVILQTGLTSSVPANITPGLLNRAAHLEPDVPCLIPQY